MNASDLKLTILIIMIFGLLIIVTKSSVKIKTFEKNWSTNRCNPLIMPFVSLFGQDATQNFMSCIQLLELKYLDDMLKPVTDNVTTLGEIATDLGTSVISMRLFIDRLRNFIAVIISNIYTVILNLLIEIQRTLIWIKGVVSKMTGILIAITFNMDGSITTGESMGKGPPGELVKSLSKK